MYVRLDGTSGSTQFWVSVTRLYKFVGTWQYFRAHPVRRPVHNIQHYHQIKLLGFTRFSDTVVVHW
jgi:hypothetical protein